LIPGGASANSIESTGSPHRIFTTAFWPPMVLAEPCRMLSVVTPPARLRHRPMASSRSTSAWRTCAVIDRVPSLIPSDALWECASMMPGITYRPVPSMTCAPAGTDTLAPTAAIFPFRIRTVPFSMVPRLAVMIVAFVMATSVPAAGTGTCRAGPAAASRALSAAPPAGRAPGCWAASDPASRASIIRAWRIMVSALR
jgi:hypothetical protein